MKYEYALWKARVNDDSVRFVHIDELPASGFASVYNFSEADARSMEAAGTYKAFKGTVFSPFLKLDCDDGVSASHVEVRLLALGVGFSKFSTGNRGFHYHVPREILPSHTLPALDKQFVAREFPGADVSFYHHVGMYRQVGAIHSKTGRRKESLKKVSGAVLVMTGETLEYKASEPVNRELAPQSVFGDRQLDLLTVPYANGERHKKYCAIAARLRELNQPEDWAFVYLANVNLLSEEPLAENELQRMIGWAYSK